MDDSLKTLTEEIRAFVDARGWQYEVTRSKDLALSICLEAAELLEHFQWVPEAELSARLDDRREAINDELADVVIYCLQFADRFGINLTEAIRTKMKKNAAKFPLSANGVPSSQPKKKTVAVSGGFDPVHIGHVRMFQEARALGDELVVLLNNDNWLMKKKGYVFMPQGERAEVIRALGCVDHVVLTSHGSNPDDMSVCADLRALRPDIFANGGDRKSDNVPEVAVCAEIGCQMEFNVGAGGKVQSSSWLVEKAGVK